jgi:hypothetical protein
VPIYTYTHIHIHTYLCVSPRDEIEVCVGEVACGMDKDEGSSAVRMCVYICVCEYLVMSKDIYIHHHRSSSLLLLQSPPLSLSFLYIHTHTQTYAERKGFPKKGAFSKTAFNNIGTNDAVNVQGRVAIIYSLISSRGDVSVLLVLESAAASWRAWLRRRMLFYVKVEGGERGVVLCVYVCVCIGGGWVWA